MEQSPVSKSWPRPQNGLASRYDIVLRALRRSRLASLCALVSTLGACGVQPSDEGESTTATLQQFGGENTNVVPDKNFTLFEAAPVRPVLVLPSGLVVVTNTSDDRVELFKPRGSGVHHCGSVPVGMRPVAVSAVGNRVWVVNHLSDSVSVLRLDERRCTGQIERTLLVGDEPRDIVAARSPDGKQYAFVTAAHRGQNVQQPDGSLRDPQLTVPGVGRADVFIYDADRLGKVGDEKPVNIVTMFADSPRALAVGHDKVYAASFNSGNQTSLVRYQFVIDRGRQSLALLDADGDFEFDAGIEPAERLIEGGYPAIKGHGRCISTARFSPPDRNSNDFIMDVCVQTEPEDPWRAVSIVPQEEGVVTPECSCTNATGELQRTPPMIVRFYESADVCGSTFDAELGGCWLEPPATDATQVPLRVQEWNKQVPLTLPDRDVFTIDLTQSPPALAVDEDFRHVGTTLFGMAVHPKTGRVFVANTDARNHVRFEGPGQGVAQGDGFANTTVRGHIVESRITVLDPNNGSSKPVHLNAHIDYSECCSPTPNADSEHSLAFPTSVAISRRRNKRGRLLGDQDLYITALGSDKVAVLSTSRLEEAQLGEVVQEQANHIEVPGGPTGLALDERRNRLYVFARGANELVVINTRQRKTIERHQMFSPEPSSVVEGRAFLYNARETSSHGDSACFSCHAFGDMDGLAWDLGAPDEEEVENLGPFFARPEIVSAPVNSHFLPVKGPMTTQSLRGLANHGAMHWRGDRRGGLDTTEHVQPDGGAYNENAAFMAFNVAFPGLNGRSEVLPQEDMQKFTSFILQLTYPPNPLRALDDSLDEGQKRARSRYFGCEITDESMAQGECVDGRNIEEETLGCNCLNPPRFLLGLEERPDYCPSDPQCTLELSDFQNTCHGCHTLDPDGNSEFGVDKPGFFGTSGVYTNDAVAHILKVPHLRNMYQKVGMFGSFRTPPGVGLGALGDSIFGQRSGGLFAPQNEHAGDQVRGFGFTHAGEEDSLAHFFSLSGFTRAPAPPGPFVADNSAGFEPVFPADTQACFGEQLPELNPQFIASLGSQAEVAQLTQTLLILVTPGSSQDEIEAAFAFIAEFLVGLPEGNPGRVLLLLPIESAVQQLSLPLLACPSLPDYATLDALGCFELRTGAGCETLIDSVRGCALWGATLEQTLPNGSKVCEAAGLKDKAEMESLMFAFDSNMKPIVGQQVTVSQRSSPKTRARMRLLLQQANAGHCDVVARQGSRGYVYEHGAFLDDRGHRISSHQLSRRHRKSITYTAVPVGEGRRVGVDRDEDGIFDGRDRHTGGG